MGTCGNERISKVIVTAFLGYALSLLAGNATMISEDFNMTEVFTVLTEVIRDNFRNAKLKQHLLPALGEFLFYAATQEENLGGPISLWDVPGQAYNFWLLNNIICCTLKSNSELFYATKPGKRLNCT